MQVSAPWPCKAADSFDLTRSHSLLIRTLLFTSLSALLCLVALVCVPTRSAAEPEFPKIFTDTYKPKSGGTVDSAAQACTLCHLDAPPALNPYGKSVNAALKQAGTKKLTPAILHSIDDQDADGDGFSNTEEISKDFLPGDPKSHPAGNPTSAVTAAGSSGRADSASGDQGAPSPWDVKAAILEKNAQHPIFIHFPIGLFIFSLFFDLLGKFKKIPGLITAGYYNLLWAALTSIVSVVTGVIAWQWEFGGDWNSVYLRLHLIFGITTCVLLFILLAVRKKMQKEIGDPVTPGYLALAFVTVAVIGLTGHIGGILSGVVK